MRAHLVKPFYQTAAPEILLGNAWLLLVALGLFVVGRRVDVKTEVLDRIRKAFTNVQVEEAGETGTTYEFDLQISVLKEEFSLTSLIRRFSHLGASVTSVASSANPSHRSLRLRVPKWKFPLQRVLIMLLVVTGLAAATHTLYRDHIKVFTDDLFEP